MKIEELIKILKGCAKQVFEELGTGWPEVVYQSAMEVALRHRTILYETQRILPITFADHVVGEAIPDLVIWANNNNGKVALVVDLKVDSAIKEDQKVQVERYIKELRKQMHKGEKVHNRGFVINFGKSSSAKVDNSEDFEGVQILEVSA